MVQELAAPYRGCTHVGWQQIEKHAPAGTHDAIYLSGRYGTVDAEGAFVPDAELAPVHRRIVGAEFAAFIQSAVSNGRPAGLAEEWRESDLAAWLVQYGLTNESSTFPKPPLEPPAEPV